MTGTAVSLELSEEERELVEDILEERHRTMLMEISNTDHLHFRKVLQKRAELLESVLARLVVNV